MVINTPNFLKSKLIKNTAKIFGSLIFIYLFFKKINLQDVFLSLREINVGIYAIVVIIFFANKTIAALRWWMILKSFGIREKLLSLYNVYLFGFLFNFILPSNIGGDSVRIMALVKNHKDKKYKIIISTLIDRILGLLSLFFLCTAFFTRNSFIEKRLTVIIFFILLSTLFVIFFIVYYGNIFAEKIKFENRFFKKIKDALRYFGANRRKLLQAFIVSVFFSCLMIFNQFLIFTSLGINVSFVDLMIAVSAMNILVVLPISIGGVGLREASLFVLLGASITKEQIVSYTVTSYSMFIYLLIFFLLFYFAKLIRNRKNECY